jgi:hypothetical protein
MSLPHLDLTWKMKRDTTEGSDRICSFLVLFSVLLLSLTLPLSAAGAPPVSFSKDIVPIFKRSCTGCHHPGKLKGELDLTSYAAFQKGGKHGSAFKPGDPEASRVVEDITGDEPSMPKEGDPLSKDEIALIERWIRQGAKDDTPAEAASRYTKDQPPIYQAPPVISSVAYSPDGKTLAVSGYYEVLLHHADGSGIIDRLVGGFPRIESISFSPDGKLLATSGGAPAQFGEVQVWELSTNSLLHSFKLSNDSLYGISFSPDSQLIAFGCADKSVRIFSVIEGKELVKFDNHSDWVFGTTFTVDGKRILTGSRDKAMKLISVANGQFIDDINKLLEGVLCIARHPTKDQIAYGGELGTPRIYKIAENQGRTAANNDVNLIREFERQPGSVHAIAYSPDGDLLAVGGVGGEVRLYYTKNGKRAATLTGHDGAVFSLTFQPGSKQICTGGFDGKVRLFDSGSGDLIKEFIPVPIQASDVASK